VLAPAVQLLDATSVDRRGAEANALLGLLREQQICGTKKGRDEARRGTVVQLVGPAGLQQTAEVHHADSIGECESLLLIVRDEHGGDLQLALHLADRTTQLFADLGVERTERLVEQQHFGLVRQCACNRNALLLAAGKL
jgi:hypothetical protein